MQRRLVRIAEDPAGIVLGDAPFAAQQRLLDLELACFVMEEDVDLPGGVEAIVDRPEESVGVVLGIRVALRRIRLVTSSFVSMRRSPFVSCISQAFGGSPTSTPCSSTLIARASTRPSAKTVRLSIVPSLSVVFEHDDRGRSDRARSRRSHRACSRAFRQPKTGREDPGRSRQVPGQGLARHELDAVARSHVEGLQGVPGESGGESSGTFWTPGGHGRFAGELWTRLAAAIAVTATAIVRNPGRTCFYNRPPTPQNSTV